MRVIVAGGIKRPILLSTTEATAIMIETEAGQPTFLFQMSEDGNGYIRLQKGEDPNFDQVAKQLGLI